MTAPFRILGLDHVVLRARDPRRLVAFYRDVLGCTLEREQPAFALVQLRAGRSLIDIVAADGTAPAGPGNMDHLCLRIEPFDLGVLQAHLRHHGVEPGKAGERYGAEGDGPSLYLVDPDGNTVELKGPPLGPGSG
jgi:catechol 2,3-dioxygenase-like lactoylglutathione lyase family enzyme